MTVKTMLRLDLECPNCNAALTKGGCVRLDAYIPATHQEGQLTLSAVFGDYDIQTDLAIPSGSVVEFRCPSCEASLNITAPCKLCGASMVSLNVKGGGYLEFCSRRGCQGHALGGVGDIDEMMNLMNRMFETPYD
jgi:hypothetical protein